MLMHDVRKKNVRQLVGEWLRRIDIPMLFGLLVLMAASLLILRSAANLALRCRYRCLTGHCRRAAALHPSPYRSRLLVDPGIAVAGIDHWYP